MLKIFTSILLVVALFFTQSFVAVAAPVKTSAIDKNITLAMLDLSKPNLIHATSAKTKKQQFSSNCMQWSASQINQKAQPHVKPILKYSRKYNIDSNLVKAVIAAESCFKVKALSRAGARGLMQLMPDTAKRFGVKNSYSPQHNIRGGVKYLRFLMSRYKGDLKKAVAAYNAGEGRVDKYKGIPPFKETKQYVKNVLKTYALLSPNSKIRVKAVYYPPSLGEKPGRHGWQYNRRLAPHLYKQ